MNKHIGMIAGVIVIIGIGYFVFAQSTAETVCAEEICMIDPTLEEVIESNDFLMMEEETENMMQEDVVADGEVSTIEKPEDIQTVYGSFETYSAEKVANATGDVVIFFHATWCPSCRALIGDIEKNARVIPAGTTILKADYDTETALKKKYGVTTQHTLVQVDNDGNLIKKWSGGSKLANLLLEIQ